MTEKRVLLVEDEPRYARFLREVLLAEETRDHRLTWVESLDDAVAALGGGAFDIVLLDLGLPDADGTEALTRVSEIAPATPIVVLSSLNDLDVALESMRLGAQEYLVKGQSEHLLLPRAMRYAIERKRLQDAAAASRADAERANAVKDEFLAMLSHELRNPLAPITTALALIRRHPHPEIARELTIIERQVETVVGLVDDLLDVARITRGKLELQRVQVDLADIVSAGLETAAPLLEQRRHRVHVDVPRGALVVRGDRARLVQVVSNLLTNAAKYTDPGGNVWVAARADGDAAEIRVRDDGAGMTPALMERIFGLFEQGSQSIDRARGGLGLGLAIVQNLVTLHGGAVAAASDGPGNGSEFVVRLPLAPSGAIAEPAPQPRPSLTPAPVPRRVLIVDDNADAAEVLELGLRELGYDARSAPDAASALNLVTSLRPEVALLDIGLPVMDGYELARRLHVMLGAETPLLVAITGYGTESDREKTRAAGFAHHLVKPIDLAELTEILRAPRP